MNGFKSMVECIECKSTFQIDPSNVVKEEFEGQEGNRIWITHYDCPECGRRHYVQIDDEQTERLLAELTKRMGFLMVLRRNGKEASKKQRREFDGTKRHLTELRRKLMEQYQECEVTAKDGHVERVGFVI